MSHLGVDPYEEMIEGMSDESDCPKDECNEHSEQVNCPYCDDTFCPGCNPCFVKALTELAALKEDNDEMRTALEEAGLERCNSCGCWGPDMSDPDAHGEGCKPEPEDGHDQMMMEIRVDVENK